MRILITGVAGLLGSRLADWIIEKTDHTVIGIDNFVASLKKAVYLKNRLGNTNEVPDSE